MADRTLSSDDDEAELENLESDVNQMAGKIAEYRKSLPGQLTTTLASVLNVQRPVILTRFDVGSEPGPSADSTPGLSSCKGTYLCLSAICTRNTMALLAYKESKIDTKKRNIAGYILFFLSTLALLVLD